MHDTPAGTVEVRRQDGIAILTLTRPAAGNRITRQMAEAGVAALKEVRSDRSITGCVLTGDGDVFCTGGDYQGAGSSSAGRLEFARAHNDLAQATSRLGKPLVAAINGDAHAGGFSLIALCDLAVCANEVMPRPRVLERAIELAASTRHANPDIISIGRDLYYDTRGATPHDANERARFALVAALKALDESPA